MTQIADIADRLRRLAKRREDDGIYTDAALCDDAARTLQAVGPEPAVAVRPLEWRDLREHTFPPMWSASTVCGVYDIEERCASDTPAAPQLGGE